MNYIEKHQDITCNEGWLWIVTPSDACIGRISHDKRIVSPIHGFWGDKRLKLLAKDLEYTYEE